ncbi:uncharacterized protein LOC105446675 [Strongylocentrotus purpuratus]|uniref:Fibronectin type-III domain-containing protein n=1 Tax=Strongylocentrotus purpuratus TaxID=7668 RepID=A0A7M7HNZ4_STRPU|nr:uncharacterized protein LOC105446675 [Strongylocentrotus purpuratus]|eukprot:XP_011682054.1 PREDICTED: uncharacterized protein LOC105446675 [Strongylocentrotus purpuratus]
MPSKGKNCSRWIHGGCYSLFVVTIIVLSAFLYYCTNPRDPTLPSLSTPPRVKNVTTSAIEIEWKGDYDGDGPVCGFIVELKSPGSTSWTSVGFVYFDEDEDDFEYTIERLDANALYGISVMMLHCFGMEGVRGPEISQLTEDHEPQTKPPSLSTSTAPPCPAQNCTESPQNPSEDDLPWRMMFVIAVPVLSAIVLLQLIILMSLCVRRCRKNSAHTVVD